jgi:hypothetical protein
MKLAMPSDHRFGSGSAAKTDVSLTIIRQPEPQVPPHLPYAFAPPQRPMAQEERVSTRVREQEVVKVVRNEIQSYMASGLAVKQFSRDDFAHIADRVYSSFARRLLVERERLGMR